MSRVHLWDSCSEVLTGGSRLSLDRYSNRGPNKETPLKENSRFILQLLVALCEKHICPHWCATVHDTAL
jgi:hypothetical protein